MIKKDCIMYVEELNKCNGLTKLDCENCKFYNNENKDKYIKNMKYKGLYFGYEYRKDELKNMCYQRVTSRERESLR